MLLIIQTGDPVELAKPLGCFSDYFIQAMSLQENFTVCNVHHGATLPWDIESFSRVIITGSAAMVTEQTEWMTNTQRWLETAIKQKCPILGVCFGHQLLADMLGGEVAYNPKGRHMGISECRLNTIGHSDKLLGGLSQDGTFNTLVSHQQSVIKAPDSVKVLGSCDRDENHAFRYQDHVWGVQFHPEWTPAIMQAYIKQRHDDLVADGLNPKSLIDQLQPCEPARQLLDRFNEMS